MSDSTAVKRRQLTAPKVKEGRYAPRPFEQILREQGLYGMCTLAEACLALGMHFVHGRKLVSLGQFPVDVLDIGLGTEQKTYRVPIAQVWSKITGQEIPFPGARQDSTDEAPAA